MQASDIELPTLITIPGPAGFRCLNADRPNFDPHSNHHLTKGHTIILLKAEEKPSIGDDLDRILFNVIGHRSTQYTLRVSFLFKGQLYYDRLIWSCSLEDLFRGITTESNR